MEGPANNIAGTASGPPSPGTLAALAGFGGHPSRNVRPDAAPPSEAASVASDRRRMAERVGFEPTCRLRDKTLSRRPRYDHFGTSPCPVLQRGCWRAWRRLRKPRLYTAV